jgi:competence protein ComEA
MLDIIKDYKAYIIGGLTLLIIFILSGFLFFKSDKKEENLEEERIVEKVEVKEKNVQEEKPVYFNVDVKGTVKKPGVFNVKEGSIINDVLKLAGLKSNSSTKYINLSKKVVDEMVIYVYSKSEIKKLTEIKKEDCFTNEVDISECDGASIIIPGESNSSSSNNNSNSPVPGKVNINTATKEQLMTLTGIGESKALAIIKYREENNGFKDISEIMNVSGIGEALYNKVKDNITI